MQPQISQNSKTCPTCNLFDFKPDPSTKSGHKLNRECLYKGKIATLNGQCVQWQDPRTLKQRMQRKTIRIKAFTE